MRAITGEKSDIEGLTVGGETLVFAPADGVTTMDVSRLEVAVSWVVYA